MRGFQLVLVLLSIEVVTAQHVRYVGDKGRFWFDRPVAWQVDETPAGVRAASPDGLATFAVTLAQPGTEIELPELADGYEQLVRRERRDTRVVVAADGPEEIAGVRVHCRRFVVGDGERAVRLDVAFVPTAGGVLIAAATCAETRRATHGGAIDAMRQSLVRSQRGDASSKARARRGLGARLRELLGADAVPEAQPGRKGRTYRHVIGFSMWHPDDWRVVEQDDYLQLVPPDPATDPSGPLELYFIIGDTVEGTGITRPDDPRALAWLDGQVRGIVASLQRRGQPVPVATTRGEGCSVEWVGRTDDGRELLARCYVTIVRRNGIALLALGLPDAVAVREGDLRAIFASFGFGEGERDPALVGAWRLVSTTSIRNESPFESDWSRARAVGETQSRITFTADGRYERVDDWHMIAIAGDISLEDRDRTVDRGTWCAGAGDLFLISEQKTWKDARYRVERTARGSRLRLVANGRGETWEPAR